MEAACFGLDATREKQMAKYRHRIFEMYDFRDEAIHALTPKTSCSVPEPTAPESWIFEYLAVSYSASVTHVRFKGTQAFGEETVNGLRKEFAQLADSLAKDSKVLLDFAGVTSFCAAAINELILFRQKLRIKGSRMALCGLTPTAQASFLGSVHHEPDRPKKRVMR